MSRSTKIRHNRLLELEAEFKPLLLSCLRESVERKRYGLFGQHDHLYAEEPYLIRILRWPEAERVVEMAAEIQALCSDSGQSNALCKRFLYFRSLRDSNVPGEPKLAKQLLEELSGKEDS